MKDFLKELGRVIAPLLVHLGITFVVAYVGITVDMVWGLGLSGDTLLTTLSALCSLPILWRMWKRDRILLPASVKEQKRGWPFYLLVFAGGAAASLAGSYLMGLSGLTERFSNQVQENLFAAQLWLQILGLGLIVPAAEELIFRGLFYERLREWLPRGWGIICAAGVFALYHGNPIQMIYAFPMALLLHLCYEKGGSLAVPLAFHMGANLISILVEYF